MVRTAEPPKISESCGKNFVSMSKNLTLLNIHPTVVEGILNEFGKSTAISETWQCKTYSRLVPSTYLSNLSASNAIKRLASTYSLPIFWFVSHNKISATQGAPQLGFSGRSPLTLKAATTEISDAGWFKGAFFAALISFSTRFSCNVPSLSSPMTVINTNTATIKAPVSIIRSTFFWLCSVNSLRSIINVMTHRITSIMPPPKSTLKIRL